jgi:hypothetical protein
MDHNSHLPVSEGTNGTSDLLAIDTLLKPLQAATLAIDDLLNP